MLTKDFALSEFVSSDTATRHEIDNTPPPMVLATLTNVLIPKMQAVRDLLGVSVIVKSGYRCPALNTLVRGSPTSDHVTGNAADFVAPRFGTPRRVCEWLMQHASTLQYDQLIYEVGWVHVSFSARQRNQVLTAHFAGGRVTYTRGLA